MSRAHNLLCMKSAAVCQTF